MYGGTVYFLSFFSYGAPLSKLTLSLVMERYCVLGTQGKASEVARNCYEGFTENTNFDSSQEHKIYKRNLRRDKLSYYLFKLFPQNRSNCGPVRPWFVWRAPPTPC